MAGRIITCSGPKESLLKKFCWGVLMAIQIGCASLADFSGPAEIVAGSAEGLRYAGAY